MDTQMLWNIWMLVDFILAMLYWSNFYEALAKVNPDKKIWLMTPAWIFRPDIFDSEGNKLCKKAAIYMVLICAHIVAWKLVGKIN